jgi:hypothetical protein
MLCGRQSNVILKLFGTTKSDRDAEDADTVVSKEHPLNQYVFHPDSNARRNWDMIAIFLVIYTVFVLPTRTAFLWQVCSRTKSLIACVYSNIVQIFSSAAHTHNRAP